MPVPFVIKPAEGSQTFHIPDAFLDRKMSLPALWDYHLHNSSDHPLFMHDDGAGGVKSYTWAQGVRATHRAGRVVLEAARSHGIEPNSVKPPPIGLLAVAGRLLSILFLYALLTKPCVRSIDHLGPNHLDCQGGICGLSYFS